MSIIMSRPIPSLFSVSTPASLFGAALQGIQGKFYGLGLMYSLNSRITFKSQPTGGDYNNTVNHAHRAKKWLIAGSNLRHEQA